MTGNAQIDRRKYLKKKFTLTTAAGGQFESLQGVFWSGSKHLVSCLGGSYYYCNFCPISASNKSQWLYEIQLGSHIQYSVDSYFSMRFDLFEIKLDFIKGLTRMISAALEKRVYTCTCTSLKI